LLQSWRCYLACMCSSVLAKLADVSQPIKHFAPPCQFSRHTA